MAPSRIAAHAHVLVRDTHASKARTVAAPIAVILLVVLLFAAVTSSLIIWLKRRLRAPARTISPFGMGITLDAGAGDRDMENVTASVSPTIPSSSSAGARFNKDAAVSGRASESRKSTLSAVSPTSIHTVGTSASKRMTLDAVPPESKKSTVLAAPEPESPLAVALDLQTPIVRIRPASSQSQAHSSYDRHLAPAPITARTTTPTVEDEIELSVQASRLVELQTEIGRVGFSVEELLSSLSRLRASADVETDPDAPPPTYDMRI